MITSELGYKAIKKVLERLNKILELDEDNLMLSCESGVILGDIIERLKDISDLKKYEFIILPEKIYDFYGKDLLGESYKRIYEKLKVEVNLV